MTGRPIDPTQHIWWLMSRASGIVALGLIAASVILGLTMANKLKRGPRMAGLHEQLSLAGLVAIAIHGVTLLGDPWLHPGLSGITVPFQMGYRTVFTEYFWNSSFCDPCVTNPPTNDEIAAAGATWIANQYGRRIANANVVVTRLHLRYTPESFPEDLVFQETADQEPWQARYVVHHRFRGDTSCREGRAYESEVATRQRREVANLVELTGWDATDIRRFQPHR